MRMLGFVGTTRLRMACELLPPVIRHWYEQWCFGNELHTCKVDCSPFVDVEEFFCPLVWQRAKSASGSILLAGNWQSILFGSFAGEVPGDDTADHLLCDARLALINSVFAELGVSDVSLLENESLRPSSNALDSQVLLQLHVGQSAVYLLLDAALLNGVLEPPVLRKELVDRKQALGNARVKLSVCLPLVSLSIGEIKDLHPGDTLLSSALLAEPVSLQLAEGVVVAGGYLATQNDHLAVQLKSIN
ncbi:FliM/FliN family flagellar motor C-terminal domain-containing protein [Pseudomonas cichorii]|nr:FliM/FliN family flagellar motor C-terminal domain-containing protein [Pseudomonas cichorii]